ncbi:MAG: hypothetical protein SPD86_08435 [Prevotella sp.]|nr:hypothetical protein [Prevotella sp.]
MLTYLNITTPQHLNTTTPQHHNISPPQHHNISPHTITTLNLTNGRKQ